MLILLIAVIVLLLVAIAFMSKHIQKQEIAIESIAYARDLALKKMLSTENLLATYVKSVADLKSRFLMQADVYKAVPHDDGIVVVDTGGRIVANLPHIENDENSAMVRAFAFAIGIDVMVAAGIDLLADFSPRTALLSWVDRLTQKA